MDVADDADDRDLGLVNRKALTDRIAGRPVALRRRRADHGDERATLAIGLLEDAASQQRNPHRPEVLGRRRAIVRAGLRVGRQVADCQPPRAVPRKQRQPAGRTGHLDSRNAAQALESTLPEFRLPLRRGIPRRREIDAEGNHVIGVESRGLLLHFREAAYRQPRTDEQHERDRDFAHDEQPAEPALGDAAGAARALFQIAVNVLAGELLRRSKTEQQAREGGNRETEQQHVLVHRHRAGDSKIGWAHGDQRSDEPHGDDDARHASQDREDDALRQKLRENPSAAGAEGDADRHLLMASARAREQQSGHVRRRDQQQQPNGCEQEEHRLPDVGHEVGTHRCQLNSRELVRGREVAFNGRGHNIHICLRAVDAERWLQPCHH